ncbi:hypothetical protein [Nocardioides sp. GCM10030258]|uniref:hypothetical protein n=1 Tax=unclassified Nocardioides TaxID=2615069 RepID=UPI00360C78A9
MTGHTWEDLQHEYETDTIGHLWIDEVERIVRRIADKYPPAVYSETGNWDEAALENLTQDVVVTQLLEEGQLDYIMTVATSIDRARALLTHTVKRTLGRSRRRTVIDNLLDRFNAIKPFAPGGHTGPQPTEVVLMTAANLIAKLPRVRIINSDRAPIVYTAETLDEIIRIVTETVGEDILRRDLERILRLVLSDYVPSALVEFEGGLDEPDRAFTPEQEVAVQDVVTRLSSLPPEALTILAFKIDARSDDYVASQLNVSRPIAARRFKEASNEVGNAIRELSPTLQDEVLARFADFLLTEHLPHNDSSGGTR